MYGGTIIIDRKIVSGLLTLATTLLIMRLKHHCIEYLNKYIDNANCLFIKNLAQRLNITELSKTASDYIDNNVDGCLTESVDILDLDIQSLKAFINELRFRCNIDPEIHLKCIIRWTHHNMENREKEFYDFIKTCDLSKIPSIKLITIIENSPVFKISVKCFLDILHVL